MNEHGFLSDNNKTFARFARTCSRRQSESRLAVKDMGTGLSVCCIVSCWLVGASSLSPLSSTISATVAVAVVGLLACLFGEPANASKSASWLAFACKLEQV